MVGIMALAVVIALIPALLDLIVWQVTLTRRRFPLAPMIGVLVLSFCLVPVSIAWGV